MPAEPESRLVPSARLGAVAGWAGALAGLGGVAAALALSPWFSWTDDALSDLGHPSRDSWLVFGAALALSGALEALFGVAVGRRLPRGPLGALAMGSLVAGGLSLSAIGVVNESYGSAHLFVSVTYFTFEALGIGLTGIALAAVNRRRGWLSLSTGALSGAFGIMVSTAMLYGAPFPSQAIPELIASLLFSAWALWMGWSLWTGSGAAGNARAQAAQPRGAPPP